MRRITHFVYDDQSYAFEYLQSMQDNFGDTVPRTRRIVGADGGFDEFGTTAAPAEIGNLQGQLVLFVNDTTQMTAKVDNFRRMSRGSKGLLYMMVEDGTIRYCRARVNNISTPISEDNHSGYIIRASVTFQVSDPHWYVPNTEEPRWGEFTWGNFTYGGEATENVVTGTSTEFTITVGGTVQTLPRIVISCGTGETAQNITLQRRVDGAIVDEITFTDTLVANDEVEINCKTKSVKKNDVDAFDDFSFDGHPDWIRLQPGNNTIRVTMANAGDDASVYFYYDDKYV